MKFAPAVFTLVLLASAGGKDAPPVPVDDKVVVLEPLRITETPYISFAIDITIYASPGTKKVSRIFITRVAEYSDAAKAGLREGDEIVQVEGQPVKGMDARVAPDSPLGRLLLNRDPGDLLNLEVVTRRTKAVTLRAQRGRPEIPR